MDRLHVGDFGGGNNVRDIQIRFTRRRIADANRLIGQFQISRVAVGRGVHNSDLNPELATGADDPQRNFTTICDEDLGKHLR